MSSAYEILSQINVSDKTEKKNGLTYLSWSFAWSEALKYFPKSTYKVYKNNDGWNYHHDNKTAWVEVGCTINDIEHIEMLPVMDFRNKSITLDNITSMDVNKAVQRALTKAIARHGLGLYIYAGEDLPEQILTADEKIDLQQRIKTLLADTKTKEMDFLNYFKVRAISDLNKIDIDKAIVMLEKKLKDM